MGPCHDLVGTVIMPAMKSFACVLFAAALLAGCQNDSNSKLEARVKKLEDQNAKYAEAMDFLQKVYDSQKQQQEQQKRQQEEQEPDPNAVFAVDITQSIKGGLVEGPATGAPVTIVEAWDFA
jgi:hypothetical protein